MIYLFLANGFEESEALVTLDMLRRAQIEVNTVGVGNAAVTGSHGITVFADCKTEDVSVTNCTGVVLPGGMPGTENLFGCSFVTDCVKHCAKNCYPVCAICAAPVIPGRLGLLNGESAVCFPGFEKELLGAEIMTESCVVSHNFITAKAAGSVYDFSYEIIKYMKDGETANKILSSVYYF